MFDRGVKRHHTLSFYLMVLGFIPGRWGARIWLAWSLASVGILWDRLSDCDVTQVNPYRFDKRFALTHIPFLPLALWRLR